MKKTKKHIFRKDVYLLGKDKDGVSYWLEAPSWDCDWYWGFGYVKTYTNNNNPEESKDIESHQHIDSSFLGKENSVNGDYCHNIFDSKLLNGEKTFTYNEGWELSELFAQFYHLREQAEFWGRGKMNISSTSINNWKDEKMANKINKEIIPVITARIMEILTPIN